MRLLRLVLVCASFGILTNLTPAAAQPLTPRERSQVAWYWSANLTLREQWFAAVVAATPEARCVARHESDTSGGYRAQNASGASGKYQFMPHTGDTAAVGLGKPELVGVPARDWAPWVQDEAFGWTWARWPSAWGPDGCG